MKRDGIIYKSFRINLSGSEDLPSGKNLIPKHNSLESSDFMEFFFPQPRKLEEMKIFKEMLEVDRQNPI